MKAVTLQSTPGPWYWHNDGFGRWSLRTPDRGQLIVLDIPTKHRPRFAHWTGMLQGMPRERRGGVLLELGTGFSDPGVMHPDARLVESAPLLQAALTSLLARYEHDGIPNDSLPTVEAARAALASSKVVFP